jgi:hypothetical protein
MMKYLGSIFSLPDQIHEVKRAYDGDVDLVQFTPCHGVFIVNLLIKNLLGIK